MGHSKISIQVDPEVLLRDIEIKRMAVEQLKNIEENLGFILMDIINRDIDSIKDFDLHVYRQLKKIKKNIGSIL